MTAFASNKAWEYRFNLTPIAALPGQHCLAITSQFFGAKKPDELVTQFKAVITDADVAALREHLNGYEVKP